MLGFIGWKVTVISSNFIASNVNFKYGNEYSRNCKILTIKNEYPELSKKMQLLEACKKMILPIFILFLTTICAFLSLIFIYIKPIIDFGWMMTLGLLVSLLVTFTSYCHLL